MKATLEKCSGNGEQQKKSIKMWLFKKKDKELLKSQEFELLIRKYSELATHTEILRAQLAAMDTKIDAYRLEIKNVKKKAQQMAEDMEEEENENNISNDFPSLL